MEPKDYHAWKYTPEAVGTFEKAISNAVHHGLLKSLCTAMLETLTMGTYVGHDQLLHRPNITWKKYMREHSRIWDWRFSSNTFSLWEVEPKCRLLSSRAEKTQFRYSTVQMYQGFPSRCIMVIKDRSSCANNKCTLSYAQITSKLKAWLVSLARTQYNTCWT